MWPTETEYGAGKTNKMPFFLIKEHNPETLKRKITKFELNLYIVAKHFKTFGQRKLKFQNGRQLFPIFKLGT